VKYLSSAGKEVPTRAEEPFLRLFVFKKGKMVQPVLTKAVLQPAMQGSCHVHGTSCWNLPTFPYSTFFFYHLSSKWIV